jgi:hypothetical protein
MTPSRAAPDRRATRFSCKACGARYVDDAWATLELAHRIEPAEVRRLVLEWPDDVCIEVRSCESCKAPISARAVGAPPTPR